MSRGPADPMPTGWRSLTPSTTVPDGPLDAVARYAVAFGALSVSVEIAVERWRQSAGADDEGRIRTAAAEMDRLSATLDRARRQVGT